MSSDKNDIIFNSLDTRNPREMIRVKSLRMFDSSLSTCNPDVLKRVCVEMNHNYIPIMRNFSILYPNQLAVSSTPKNQDQINALRHIGVTLIITLTEEEPLDPKWFINGNGIENFFCPLSNYEPPTIEQMDKIYKRVLKAIQSGGRVVEHCGGGKGRAGTIAACLLLRFGKKEIPTSYVNKQGSVIYPNDAIEYIQSIRPGSLETNQQEKFVHEYSQHIWKELDNRRK